MPESVCNVCDLPYDVLFELFRYMSAVDATALLSTCRDARKHIQDASIWQRFCSRYGLRSVVNFGGLSFYAVYTQLLHPYGPLLGLWAGDYPYRGNIIDFRLIPGDDHEQGGIIGEVWRFPQEPTRYPVSPSYVRALKIGFDGPFVPSPTAKAAQSPSPHNVSPKARVCCSVLPPVDHAHWHSTYLEVVPPSSYGYLLQGYRRPYPHPDFPPQDASWYDSQRGLPRLNPSIPVLVDQRELVRIYPAVRLPIIFASTTPHLKPAAISIHCSGGDDRCTQMYQPALPFDDLSTAPPRYYPLIRDIRSGIDPRDVGWKFESLEGLWLGAMGRYGTEVLHLTWHREQEELRAIKITGDANVPRGAHSWTLHTSHDPLSPPTPMPAGWTSELPGGCLMYTGIGTISERGYPFGVPVPLSIAIVNTDEIRIFWDQINDTRIYMRYKDRENVAGQ
ncbi:uncharacterized protein C8Q71DRAFT_703639 [Rhodofomes roseus]|uniref:F-box domain-containing protein n=1 Tax=Rhodofomes roseus TaxID=34475 RepID=A0A4Y9Z6Z2_9APHY|nr:uncharacterized protein C8Q71DRAFT_703639 [Rhodofomes roseus]KAH9839209.1 hypothetical protein C8Q71DRAFT_703639 [Rhodofomes roseus]TFY69900.1 hypothetical protein EVJ58_g134 [Rhodofomes roseus]